VAAIRDAFEESRRTLDVVAKVMLADFFEFALMA